MKYIINLFFACLLCTFQMHGQNLVNMTNFVSNPSFENNTKDGWQWESTAWSTNTDFETQEFWNGTFNMYQVINNLPNGKYRVGVQAFYRRGENNNAYNYYINNLGKLTAKLYANDAETTVVSVFSEGSNYWMNGCVNYGNLYYPNNMESANYFFNTLNLYHNYVTVDVTDHKLTIGIRNNEAIQSNWAIFDNWSLEFYGDEINMTSLSIDESNVTMTKGETMPLTYSFTPMYITDNDITWSSNNESVATVNAFGVVTAHKNGVAAITCNNASSGLNATCIVNVNSVPLTSENVIINEIQSRNIDMFVDPSFNYGGWIELYNPTDNPVNLGDAFVKDGKGNAFHFSPNYGVIPAHGYKTVWFDHNNIYSEAARNQAEFKLDAEGGTITIADEDGNDITTVAYPATIGRTSYARTQDGGDTWAFTPDPTPEKSNNNTTTWANTQLEAPAVDKDGTVFRDNFYFNVTIPDGCTLRYTTDGSTPTLTNGNTSLTGRFYVFNTSTTYRFRLFKDDNLPSEVVTRSFIYSDRDYTLPIVSVTTLRDNLYDDYLGVYVKGVNGRSGNGVTGKDKANWNMDWDRPVNFEYLVKNEEGEYAVMLNQEVDFAISGGWSRKNEPHSFKLKANKLYGPKDLAYQWFDEKPYNKYKQILVRNGGNDNYAKSRVKDNMLQQILYRSGLYIDTQARQPVHVFLNGEFKGTMHLREVSNRQYGYANYGLDTDYQDAFEMSVDSGYVQGVGTKDAFKEWYELSKNASDSEAWKRITELVDIDEFTNYMATQFYLTNWDWPHNNLKAFRARTDYENGHDEGKFHFVIFDLDNCYDQSFNPFYDFQNQSTYTFYPIYNEDGSSYNITAEVEVVTIFLNMLNNEEFKKKFLDTFCIVTGSVFEPERCAEIINEIHDEMKPYMDWESNGYWVDVVANQLKTKLTSSMQQTMMNYMKSFFGISNTTKISLTSNISKAEISVNDIAVPTGKFSGELISPVTIKAEAPAGYEFVGWKDVNANIGAANTVFDMNSNWDYYDQGSLDGTNWISSSYTNTNWNNAQALFGFRSRNDGATIVTWLDYGGDASNKRPTYYFRKKFNLKSTPSEDDVFTLKACFDDGYIIYVNGHEVAHYRLNSGASYNDYAWEYGSDPYDIHNITIPTEYLHKGDNVIAVEIHNQSATSSDIYWDASLSYTSSNADFNGIISDEDVFTLNNENYELIALFRKVADDELLANIATPIKVNEVSAGNDVYVNDLFKKSDWFELYNNTDSPINVAGLYVSDDIDEPTKYQIPANMVNVNTIIPANGHLIIWADNLKATSQIHTNFKLSNNDGNMVIVTSSDEFVNNNISFFEAHPALKSFADALVYNSHAYNQTVGRYPDGSNTIYKMYRPSIAKANYITSDDEMIGIDNGIMDNSESFTIDLAEGWNWVSHPLQDAINVNCFDAAVNRIIGESREAYYSIEAHKMKGMLKTLDSSTLYKFHMAEDATYDFNAEMLSNKTIALRAGWNWIGYPADGNQNLNSAFADTRIDDGDIIMGQSGFSVYDAESGWSGTLHTLSAGKGYMYKSASAKGLTFSSTSNNAKLRKVSASTTNEDKWGYDSHAYPNVMGVIAKIELNGEAINTDEFNIVAYADDECRGASISADDLLYLTIYGDGGENISFKAIDADGEMYAIKEMVEFESNVMGKTANPFILSIMKDATSIAETTSQTTVTIGYYNLSGQYVGCQKDSLRPGIYLARLSNGKYNKIFIK